MELKVANIVRWDAPKAARALALSYMIPILAKVRM